MNLPLKQRAFVDHYVTCRNGAEAARRAGYAVLSARITASRLLTKANIKDALAAKEADLSRQTAIDKGKVIQEVLEGVRMARMQADGGNMIRGWVSIAKMLGLDKQETVKVAVSAGSDALRAKYEAMSDDELLAIVEGHNSISLHPQPRVALPRR